MQVVLQSGLDEKWWADSMGCYCYLRNVQDFFFVKGRHHLKGDVEKPETIFWTIAGNCVCQSSVPKGESFPIPLRFF